jgi:starch-binding outer membrane protein, SusD/RagB family
MKKLSSFARILMLGLAMAVVVPSCVNLDEELFSAVTPGNFFKTPEEFIAALGAAYTSLYGYNIGSDVNALAETSTDEMVVPTRGQDWDDGGHWRRLHLHSWNWEDPVIGRRLEFRFQRREQRQPASSSSFPNWWNRVWCTRPLPMPSSPN